MPHFRSSQTSGHPTKCPLHHFLLAGLFHGLLWPCLQHPSLWLEYLFGLCFPGVYHHPALLGPASFRKQPRSQGRFDVIALARRYFAHFYTFGSQGTACHCFGLDRHNLLLRGFWSGVHLYKGAISNPSQVYRLDSICTSSWIEWALEWCEWKQPPTFHTKSNLFYEWNSNVMKWLFSFFFIIFRLFPKTDVNSWWVTLISNLDLV